MKTQSNRVSDFRDCACSLFPKATFFTFISIKVFDTSKNDLKPSVAFTSDCSKTMVLVLAGLNVPLCLLAARFFFFFFFFSFFVVVFLIVVVVVVVFCCCFLFVCLVVCFFLMFCDVPCLHVMFSGSCKAGLSELKR